MLPKGFIHEVRSFSFLRLHAKILRQMQVKEPKIIVALDDQDIVPVMALVDHLDPARCRLKVGPILFIRYGPKLIESLKEKGFSIFLDLKLHDIPNTVANACYQAARLGVWMLSLHLSGGLAMLNRARESVAVFGKKRPLLVGISVLTSMNPSDIQQIGHTQPLFGLVETLAAIGQEACLDGIVCSAEEVSRLKSKHQDLLWVTPGIRFEGESHDQKRVMTPRAAFLAGSDYLVIGRPITEALDPLKALEEAVLSCP